MKINLNMQLDFTGENAAKIGETSAQKSAQIISEQQLSLLQSVQEFGSIKTAAAAEKMSYKTAWDKIRAASAAYGSDLLEISSKKGGAKLSAAGQKVLAKYQQFLEFKHMLDGDLQPKISARNRLRARVCEIASGQNCAKITAKFCGVLLRAKISQEALSELKIEANQELNFLFKTFALRLSERPARCENGRAINQFCARVDSCQQLKNGEFLCKISLLGAADAAEGGAAGANGANAAGGVGAAEGGEVALTAISPRALTLGCCEEFCISEDEIIIML